MAKLESSNHQGFTFVGREGRRYCVPFGQNIERRNPMARASGKLAKVNDCGNGRPMAKWQDAPKRWLELESLEEDYKLEKFIVEGTPMAHERTRRPEPEPVTDAGLMIFRNVKIGMRVEAGSEEMNLTDMWRANGGDLSRRPSKWADQVDTKRFLAEMSAVLGKDTDISGESGGAAGGGGTWAHWQIAFRYASYLSPAFAIWVNQAAREKMEARTSPPVPVVAPELVAILSQLATGQVEARAEFKAVRGDVETVAAMAAEVDQKVLRAQQTADAAIAGLESLRHVPVTPPAETEPTPVDISRLSMPQILDLFGLPVNKTNEKHFLCGKVVLDAIDDVGLRWPVPRASVEKLRPGLTIALAKLHDDGFSVVERRLRFTGRGRQVSDKCLVSHMIQAMRKSIPDAAAPTEQTRLPHVK